MKVTATLFTLFVVFSPTTRAQESTQPNLPAGAIARLGKGSINGVQYAPDGTRLAVATSIGIWLYDTANGQEIALLTGHRSEVRSVAFSPDGRTLASGSADKTVCLWDTVSWTHKQICNGHQYKVVSVSFSPDGSVLASARGDGGDKRVYLWDAVTGECKGTFAGHRDAVNSVAFSPESGVLASGSSDGMVLLWRMTDSSQ
ncbi:WD40 repeat domain-containing protein [Candidatus Poribacteria bacterium]|nr:WD40 repeat domain-containing protein [Candidatus Poribacteria bacterium]